MAKLLKFDAWHMQVTMVHFLHPYGLSVKCILFKCHKHIVKLSI